MSLIPKRPVVCKADDGTIYDLAVSGGTRAHRHTGMDCLGEKAIGGKDYLLYRYKQGQAPRPF